FGLAMNSFATQFGSGLSLFGGVQKNAPDCERTFPKLSECQSAVQAAASPPRLDPPTMICRGSAAMLYRRRAQGINSELRKSAKVRLHVSSRKRASPGASS